MKTTVQSIITIVLLFSAFDQNVYAHDESNWCEKMIAKRWKRDSGSRDHFGEKVIISKSGHHGKFKVKIKDQNGGDQLNGDDFELTCTATPLEASLTGIIEVKGCEHPYTLKVPYIEFNGQKHYDKIAYESGEHTPSNCPEHAQDSQIKHPGSAHGHDDS